MRKIGMIISMDGNPMPSGKIFANPVDCNLFRMGRHFSEKPG